jgi:TctA family transporter
VFFTDPISLALLVLAALCLLIPVIFRLQQRRAAAA